MPSLSKFKEAMRKSGLTAVNKLNSKDRYKYLFYSLLLFVNLGLLIYAEPVIVKVSLSIVGIFIGIKLWALENNVCE